MQLINMLSDPRIAKVGCGIRGLYSLLLVMELSRLNFYSLLI